MSGVDVATEFVLATKAVGVVGALSALDAADGGTLVGWFGRG